jgi:hypothetical protein
MYIHGNVCPGASVDNGLCLSVSPLKMIRGCVKCPYGLPSVTTADITELQPYIGPI